MIPVALPEALVDRIPPEYLGRWRIVFKTFTKVNEKVKMECFRCYGTAFDD